MMTLLKHIIYECCINIFFDRVILNFSDKKPEDYAWLKYGQFAMPLIRQVFPSFLSIDLVGYKPDIKHDDRMDSIAHYSVRFATTLDNPLLEGIEENMTMTYELEHD
jgi:hypothetical protein